MKVTTLSVLALSVLSLAACQNTVHGFGADLEKAGKSIQGEKTSSAATTTTAAQPTTTTSSAPGYNYNSY